MSAPPNETAGDRRGASHADYEELRAHVPLAKPPSAEPGEEPEAGSRKRSVLQRLVEAGRRVVRRFRSRSRVPPAPMARIHER